MGIDEEDNMSYFTRFDSSNRKQIAEAGQILSKAYEYHKEGIFTKRDASEYAIEEAKTTTPMPQASNFSEMITILEDIIRNNGKLSKKKRTGRDAVLYEAYKRITGNDIYKKTKTAEKKEGEQKAQEQKQNNQEEDLANEAMKRNDPINFSTYAAGYRIGYCGAIGELKRMGLIGNDTASHLLSGVKLGTYFKLSLKYEEIMREIFTEVPGDKELLDGANR